MQRHHPLDKRIQRAGGLCVKPLRQRILATLHPVLHDYFNATYRWHRHI